MVEPKSGARAASKHDHCDLAVSDQLLAFLRVFKALVVFKQIFYLDLILGNRLNLVI
jgi:hypothetical protein